MEIYNGKHTAWILLTCALMVMFFVADSNEVFENTVPESATNIMMQFIVLPPDLQESGTNHSAYPENTIAVTTHFYVPQLDLRGYEMNHFDVERWFLERINYHRENYGLHPYSLYPAAVITSIEHSLDMRDNEMSQQASSDGRTHQERHHRWFGYARTMVTSSHISSHTVDDGPLTQEGVVGIVDRILQNERTHSFIMNPTYYYIGIGFSIQPNARGRLSITMASLHGERAAHRARTSDEREEHRREYLEKVRQSRGWQE